MWQKYNPNPQGNRVGDCVIRAISKITNQTWEKTYCELVIYGLMMCDMPSANHVWGKYLKDKGYKRHIPADDCPDCYTVEDFANEHFKGKFILALNGHVIAVEDGSWFDTWNSKDEIVQYYWTCESEE